MEFARIAKLFTTILAQALLLGECYCCHLGLDGLAQDPYPFWFKIRTHMFRLAPCNALGNGKLPQTLY